MYSYVLNILYLSWMYIHHRNDINYVVNGGLSIFNNRKQIKYHFQNIAKLTNINIITDYII